MATISMLFKKTAKTSLAAGMLATFVTGATYAQGVVMVDDYETTAPATESGPTLPSLRPRAGAPASYEPSGRAGSSMRNQAMVEGLPPEMLADGMEESEAKPGLFSRLPKWKMPSVFGSDTQEQPPTGYQPPNEYQTPREQQSSEAKPGYRGPRRLSRENGPQAIGMFPRRDARPKQTPKLPSFSLKKLFGGGEETVETSPDLQGTAPAEGYSRRQFQQPAVGAPSQQSAPLPNAGPFSNQPVPNVNNQSGSINGVLPAQMQIDDSQASLESEDGITQVGYNQRGNLGSQLRPMNNRPASLFGGDLNGSSPSRGQAMVIRDDSPNNAFNRGPEVMQRLSEGGLSPNAQSPKTQPVFVSDDSQAPSSTPGKFQTPPASKPLISSVSPAMQAQTPASPQSRLVMSEPAPQVIENGTVTSQPRSQVVHNPVPVGAKSASPAPATKPTEKAVEILSQANTLAQSAQSEEELTQIVQMCRQVLAIDESSQAVAYSKSLAGWALNRRGELRADNGRERDAMLDFEDAIHTDPSLWRAVHNRGVMLAQQGQFAAAFDDFNRTVELNPNFAKAYSNRAALYTQAGDLAAALDDYRQAITLDPDLAVAHKGRGRVCHLIGNYEEALQHFDAAVLLAPGDAHIALGRADLLADMGRYAAAIEGYRQTLELDSANDTAYRSLAWIQATCPDESFRNAEQALANAELALRHAGKEDDLTLDTLAAAQANAGDFAGAQATQARAIELAPAGERSLYQERLGMYQANQPFRTEPAQPIRQATYRR